MSHAETSVVLRHVVKSYRGQRTVLRGVDLDICSGEVVGLIGPNASGKTTVLRIIAGLVQPTGGEVWVRGLPLHDQPGHMAPGLGVLFDPPGLLPQLTGLANLRMLASLRHVIDEETVRQWMGRLGLDPNSRARVGTYSQGMLQRLGVAQALMEAPDILLLDEPTNALDPEAVDLVAALIDEQRRRGATIMVASHYLEEVSRVCTRVYKMVDGRVESAEEADLRRTRLSRRDD